jgi:fructose-bisphosphate aldolase, class I
VNDDRAERVAHGRGFFAALDQSGGSTPKALAEYGVPPSAYDGDAAMFDLVHQMRTKIVTDTAFSGDQILAAILFEQTMDREMDGLPTASYLWQVKGIVPFLKIDRGLADQQDGVQRMNDIPDLDPLLENAVGHGIFGTKERSVIASADPAGITAVVDQQFALAEQVLAHGLVPILEPEVSIGSPDKEECESLLKAAVVEHLDGLADGVQVMLKISIPTVDGFWSDVMTHPRMLRVVALSGGYSRAEADARLARNPGLIASFSRALLEGLSAQQDDAAFTATLAESVREIAAASAT